LKDKFFIAAKAVSMNSNGVGGGRKAFRLGAVLVNKNSIISVGNNSYKTHPLLKYRTEWPFLHAEQHAIIRRGLDNCEGLDLYVVRILKNLNYAISYPCDVCKQLIKDVGIRNVYYIDENGEFAKWNPLTFI
jgi:deoxycytidylate deaminase|tara:strand:+ start:273 stop:668 length:396 start_codon:yes stop_codon:yes gene_type:complete